MFIFLEGYLHFFGSRMENGFSQISYMSPNISGPDKKENIPLGLISLKFSDRDIYPHTKEKYRA